MLTFFYAQKVTEKSITAIITEDNTFVTLEYNNVFPDKEISTKEFSLIIEQFVKFGLLKKAQNYTGGVSMVWLTADIYDFYQHGGFIAQEELLRANLEKLNYELLKLAEEANPSNIARINTLTGIAASITTALGLFTH